MSKINKRHDPNKVDFLEKFPEKNKRHVSFIRHGRVVTLIGGSLDRQVSNRLKSIGVWPLNLILMVVVTVFHPCLSGLGISLHEPW